MVNRELRLIVAGRIIFCSQRRNKEQPCAAVRNKQEAEDPYHVSALPLNLAKGETSVSYLLKRRGKPGGGKRINQIPNCFKSEPGCVPFPVHTGGSWRKMCLSYLKACRGVDMQTVQQQHNTSTQNRPQAMDSAFPSLEHTGHGRKLLEIFQILLNSAPLHFQDMGPSVSPLQQIIFWRVEKTQQLLIWSIFQ